MRVVSNTSPLANLAIIGRLELLRRRYEIVNMPAAVAEELAALSHPGGKQAIAEAVATGWLKTQVIKRQPVLPFRLDAGESEAIGLAIELSADVLLMDERRGREAARRMGMKVAGVLGELIHARRAGWLSSVKRELQRLRVDAGFYIDASIEAFILSQVGE